MREPGSLNILYSYNYRYLSFRGRNLSLSILQQGLNQLISDTWQQLLGLSGGTKLSVDVPVGMSEDTRSTTLGASFINEVSNSLLPLSLLREMSKQPKFTLFRPSTPNSGRSFELDPTAVREFLYSVKPIVESIAFLLQITGSGPLRMSEVVGDRYRNGSMPRNLFISHGRIFLLRTDLKSSTSWGHRSSIVHFPPPKVSQLLVYYLAVIRPLEIFLTGQLGWVQEYAAYSKFIYVIKGFQLTPRAFLDIIATHTDHYFNCRLSGLEICHVLVNIQSTFLPPIVDPSVQNFGDSQAGHSTRVANRVYGQRMDHLPGDEAASFVLAYHWCTRLHNVLSIGPDPPTPPIPYLHLPPSPMWWCPDQHIPQPICPENLLNNIHCHISTVLATATDQLARSCQNTLRDAIFGVLAAVSPTGTLSLPTQPAVTHQPPVNQRPPVNQHPSVDQPPPVDQHPPVIDQPIALPDSSNGQPSTVSLEPIQPLDPHAQLLILVDRYHGLRAPLCLISLYAPPQPFLYLQEPETPSGCSPQTQT